MTASVPLCLGIDVGTSKIAAVLYDPVQGRPVHTASAPVPAMLAPAACARFCASGDPEAPCEGAPALWDAAAVLAAAAHAVGALPAPARARVGAVCAATQMHGVVVLCGGRAATPFANWQDRACAQRFLARLRTATGHAALSQGHGTATLARWAATGALPPPAGAPVAATIADHLCAALCGDPAAAPRPAIDPTNAQAWGMVREGPRGCWAWDARALAAAGVPAEMMPAIVTSATVLARTAGAFALGACGLPAGVPVCVAVGDFQAALHAALRATPAAAARPEACLVVNIGTSAQLAVLVDASTDSSSGDEEEEEVRRSYEVRPYVDGRHRVVTAAAMMGGSAWHAFVDTVCAWQAQLCPSSSEDKCEDREAAREALQGRLIAAGLRALERGETLPCVDARFAGERHAPDARGAVTGLTATNARDLGALAAALALGVVRNLRDMLPSSVLARSDAAAADVVVVGSGNAVRRSPLFRAAVERVLGAPCTVAPWTEEAATGAAMLAADTVLAHAS